MFGRGEPMLIALETSKTVAAILELQFGSKVLLKTRGIPCMRLSNPS